MRKTIVANGALSSRYLISGALVALAGSMGLSCSSGNLASAESGESTGQVSQAVTPVSTTCACVGSNPDCSCVDTSTSGFAFTPNNTPSALDNVLGPVNTVLGIAGTVSGVFTYAKLILDFVGILKTPDPDQAINALRTQIDNVGGAIVYHEAASARTTRLDTLLGEMLKIDDDTRANGKVSEPSSYWSVKDGVFNQAVLDAAAATAFERTYVASQTSGSLVYLPNDIFHSQGFAWGSVIPYAQWSQAALAAPLPFGDAQAGLVYDWRWALPALLQLDAWRLLLFIAEDASDGLNYKHAARRQLQVSKFRADLQSHLTTLTNGLRCASQPLCYDGSTLGRPTSTSLQFDPNFCFGGGFMHWVYEVSCADIYSGMNVTIGVDCGNGYPCPDAAHAAEIKAYNDVRALEPWFDTQAMIDAMYLYENGMTDLTEADGAIRSALNYNLCIDVPGGSQAKLSSCSTTRSWTYDRQNDDLRAASTENCLDAQNALLRTPVVLAPCNGKKSQKWTYDPEHRVLNNALGNALDVPVSNPLAGQGLDTFISMDLNGLAQDFNFYNPSLRYKPEQWNQQPMFYISATGRFSVFPPRCFPCNSALATALSIGLDQAVYARTLVGGNYSGPIAVTSVNFAPAGGAIAWAAQSTSQTGAFLVGNDGKVYAMSQVNANPWQAPTPLTSASFAPPGAPLDATVVGGQTVLAVVDTSGKLQVIRWNPTSGWGAPVAVTAGNYAPPGASVSFGLRANGELDVFSIGTDGALKYMAYNPSGWSGPFPLGLGNFAPPGAPVATAVDVHGFLNVFTVGNDGALYTKWDCTPLWCGATPLSAVGFAPAGAKLAALNFNNASMDVAIVDNNGAINVLSNSGFSWQGPTLISGSQVAQPGAATGIVAETASQLDVFAVSSDGQLLESTNSGTGWSATRPRQ